MASANGLIGLDDGFHASLLAALDASGVVGSWDWDHLRHEAVYDRGAAALLAGDAELAGRVLGRQEAIRCIHPDDVENLVARTIAATKFGGLYIAEYRVAPPGAPTRWLFSRGRTVLDEAGRPVRSRGILIDITECREESQSYVALAGPLAGPLAGAGSADPLHAASHHVAAARDLLPGKASFRLRTAIEIVLMEIGQMVARRAETERRRKH